MPANLADEVHNLVKMGAIRPSKLPRSSPIVVKHKKSGDIRVCGDYKRLNQMTKKDEYPMPNLEDATTNLAGKTIFLKISIVHAYHHTPVHEPDIEKTALVFPFGLYEHTVMSFGLSNAIFK